MKEIARGAEAILYEDGDTVVKYREKKGYRIDEIDSPLRKSRTKREFSILKRCAYAGISVPKPIKISKEGDKLFMERIDGKQLDCVFSAADTVELGEIVAEMHKLGVIHGDLTTANMIKKENKVFLIDFGLGFYSRKSEDRATDLFLFKNALKSRHPSGFKEAYPSFLSSYEKRIGKEFKEIDTHLKDIENRRRYHENS